MRARLGIALLFVSGSCVLASCGPQPRTPDGGGADGSSGRSEPAAAASARALDPSDVELPPTDAELLARAEVLDASSETSAPEAEAETAPETGTETETEAETDGEAAGAPAQVDPLAPEMPAGPAPGSPEADAELRELLDESTLTQEEFDAAFKGGAGPNVEGDAIVFGPGDRTRKAPKITIGAPTVSPASTAAGKALADVAKADRGQLEACHAMALSKDPQQVGETSLVLEFDDAGTVESASLGAAIGEALDACLISVAEGWKVADAGARTATLPLTLATD